MRPLRASLTCVAVALFGLAPTMVAAQFPAPREGTTRYLAANCANCHGTDGRATNAAEMPALAGMARGRFIEQMTAFRDGTRAATIMHQLARGYSDEQIARLADYFAAQKGAP